MRTHQQKAYAVTLASGLEIVVYGSSLAKACRNHRILRSHVKSVVTFYPVRVSP